MKAIWIVADPRDVLSEGTPEATGVEVRGVEPLERPALKKRLEAHLGSRMSDEKRADVVEEIVRFLRQNRILADVSVPPQEITGGVLQILVLIGKVGRVKVEGARWSGAESLAASLGVRPGEAVDPERLLADIDWLNRNPFRRVSVVYSKGHALGETDLTLEATERFPLRVFAGYDDSGTPVTGNDRLTAGLNWGNVLRGDGQFVYQYTTDPDSKWFSAHSASLLQPLPWRHVLTVHGSYADIHGDVPAPFDLTGFNWQAGVRYEVPLPKLAGSRMSLRQSVVTGFDFKRSNNNLAFGGQQVFGTQTDVVQWSWGHVASIKDRLGAFDLRLTGYASPGRWTSGSTDGAYRLSRAGTRARYVYGKIEANRTTNLPRGFGHVVQASYQESDANLLATEQLGLGGSDSIRGYDARIANGDRGYIISNELRTPSVNALYRPGSHPDDKIHALVFFDYGSVSNKELLHGEAARTIMSSVGAGVRYAISSHLSFRSDYGWQLRQISAQRSFASRAHIGLNVTY